MEGSNKDRKQNGPTPIQSAMFLLGITGVASLSGFGMMLAKSKRGGSEEFAEGINPLVKMESGSRLAMRALGRATVYSVSGVGLFCFAVCALMGVKSMKDFTAKMQSIMPRIPPGKHSTGEDVDWDELFGTQKINIDKTPTPP